MVKQSVPWVPRGLAARGGVSFRAGVGGPSVPAGNRAERGSDSGCSVLAALTDGNRLECMGSTSGHFQFITGCFEKRISKGDKKY